MKLYEVRIWNNNLLLPNWREFISRYVSSMLEAKALVKGHTEWRINKVTIDTLTQENLILLLEGDAPGNQEVTLTPMDLITVRELIKERNK